MHFEVKWDGMDWVGEHGKKYIMIHIQIQINSKTPFVPLDDFSNNNTSIFIATSPVAPHSLTIYITLYLCKYKV